MQSLSQLYYLHGIGYEYTKYTGEHVIFDESTRMQALSCCGVDTQDTDAINQLNFALDAGTWLNLFPDTFDRYDGTSSFFVSVSFCCCWKRKLGECN